MANLTKYLIGGAVGIFLGLVIYEKFLKEETETITIVKETIVSDTVFQTVKDTVFIPQDRLKYVYLRDTIINDTPLQIRAYNGFEPTLYGNIGYQSEVAGEMLNMRLFHDLSIPQVTNTITRETTKTIIQKPSGLYATGGINSEFHWSVGATFLKDRSLIGIEYHPRQEIISGKIGFKIF